MGRIRSRHGTEERNNRDLVGISKGKRPIGRPKRSYALILKCRNKLERNPVGFIHLAQVTEQWRDLASRVMNLRVPQIVAIP